MDSNRMPRLASLLCLAALMTASCPPSIADPDPVPSPECCRSDMPTAATSPRAPGEPRLLVPLPPGWSYRPSSDPGFIRGTLANDSLAADGFIPNVLVAMDAFAPSSEPADSESPEQQALNDALADIAGSSDIIDQAPGFICGHPSLTVNYVIDDDPSTAVLIAASDRGKVWIAWINFLTNHPDDPTWVHDTQTIASAIKIRD